MMWKLFTYVLDSDNTVRTREEEAGSIDEGRIRTRVEGHDRIHRSHRWEDSERRRILTEGIVRGRIKVGRSLMRPSGRLSCWYRRSESAWWRNKWSRLLCSVSPVSHVRVRWQELVSAVNGVIVRDISSVTIVNMLL